MKLDGNSLDIDKLWDIAVDPTIKVEICDQARAKVLQSRTYIESRIKAGDTMYGVNTGFGIFANVKISQEDIEKLQLNIIRSHCCGVGEPFTRAETRAIMCLRANALLRGHSGIRMEPIEKIIEFLNHDIVPVIPQQGSVGASGDLAPLSHLALALIGEGEVFDNTDSSNNLKPIPVGPVLQKYNIQPLVLKAKEGLSLVNGCQVMTGVGLINAYEARRLCWMTDLAGAMSLEALRGSRSAFDPIIFATRPHPGEAKTARNMLKLLGKDSPISKSHELCGRVQDAYSLRCIPAVHGAAKDALRNGSKTLEIEANSSTDNPLVFAEEGKILSCGNFHGEPVAFALDFMGIAMSAMASISECRIEKLMNPAMSELPALLAPNGGFNSGLMMIQVAAASLVSENKILSHPASVDSIPTNADKEDHVSMGTIAARKLGKIIRNAENIVAMEMLCASQAFGFLKPLEPSGAVLAAYKLIEQDCPFALEDRVFSKDVEIIKKKIRKNEFTEILQNTTGELEW